MILRIGCPCCPPDRRGTVAIGEAVWATPAGVRRSVWLDEPAACSAGCALAPVQVERLLQRAARGAVQLPFPGLERQGAILRAKRSVTVTKRTPPGRRRQWR